MQTSLSPSVCSTFLNCQIEKAVDELNLPKKVISCLPSIRVRSAAIGRSRVGLSFRDSFTSPASNPESCNTSRKIGFPPEFNRFLPEKPCQTGTLIQNVVIEAHRCKNSHTICVILPPDHPFFKKTVPTHVSRHPPAHSARLASTRSRFGKSSPASWSIRIRAK